MAAQRLMEIASHLLFAFQALEILSPFSLSPRRDSPSTHSAFWLQRDHRGTQEAPQKAG